MANYTISINISNKLIHKLEAKAPPNKIKALISVPLISILDLKLNKRLFLCLSQDILFTIKQKYIEMHEKKELKINTN